MIDYNTTVRSRTVTDHDALKATASLFRDIADALDETADGYDSFTAVCRRRKLDAGRIRRFVQNDSLHKVRLNEQQTLDELLGDLPEDQDFYEKLYSHVFNIKVRSDVLLPPDYIETADTLIAGLSDREQDILYSRLGRDGRPQPLGAIAERYGVSNERIRQIEQDTYYKLHSGSTGRMLRAGIAAYNKEQEDLACKNQERQASDPEPEDIRKKYLDMPINELDLSVRAYNVLTKTGVKTLGNLLSLSEHDMGTIKGLGAKTYSDIRDVIAGLPIDTKLTREERRDYKIRIPKDMLLENPRIYGAVA